MCQVNLASFKALVARSMAALCRCLLLGLDQHPSALHVARSTPLAIIAPERPRRALHETP